MTVPFMNTHRLLPSAVIQAAEMAQTELLAPNLPIVSYYASILREYEILKFSTRQIISLSLSHTASTSVTLVSITHLGPKVFQSHRVQKKVGKKADYWAEWWWYQ